MRLCATQIRYDATLRDPNKVCCDHCDSKWACCDFARPRTDMLRLCGTQKRYVATIATQNGYDPTLRDRNICATQQRMLRPSATQKRYVATTATQNGYVATQCDRNIYATSRDPKKICCDFPLNVSRNDYES